MVCSDWIIFDGRSFLSMQQHHDGSCSFFSPFNSVNIERYDSKTCSSGRTILIHHFYMKLLQSPTMFCEIDFFFFF
jgi:hypothetical protein